MLYTTYFAKLAKLPSSIIPVAICGKAPIFYTGFQFKALAPSYSIFKDWQNSHDNAEYTRRFNEEILGKLNQESVITELYRMTGYKYGTDIALVCYEAGTKFCHRHLVADWFEKDGWSCKEL